MIKKVTKVSEINTEDLKDLEVLLADKVKEYIVVGNSYYEIYPTQALDLLEIISDVLDILLKSKQIKYEKLKLENPEVWEKLGEESVIVTINDILSVNENIESIKKILRKILDGVDPEDFKAMTIQQITQVLSKLVKVNIDSFPESFKNNFKSILENPNKDIGNIASEVKSNLESMKNIVDSGESSDEKK